MILWSISRNYADQESVGPGYPLAESGAPLPGLYIGQSLRADEKLRKQMLGKNAKRPVPGATITGRMDNAAKVNVNVPPKPRPATLNRSAESEEEGRSSLGKAKRRTRRVNVVEGSENEHGEGEQLAVLELVEPVPRPGVAMGKQKPGSYLDEILSKRPRKKRKRESR
jgi:hypothetical protein